MHIVLTDIITCPRCGPEFGLVILADRIDDRRVREGRLGCANCREEYGVSDGVADLRPAGSESTPPAPAATPVLGRDAVDSERAFRVAALLGVTGPAAPLLVHGAPPAFVAAVQEVVPDAGLVGISEAPLADAGGAGMGWALVGDVLPFRSRSLSGAALLGGGSDTPLEEALRCLGRGARLLVDPAPPELVERLERAGAGILLRQDAVVVAFDPAAG